MSVPQYLDWPAPVSPLLGGIVDALRARSKSLRNRVSRFEIGLVVEEEDDVAHERLNLDLKSWDAKPQCLSISFWDDGLLWLNARRAARIGWDCQFSFYGDYAAIEPVVLRDNIERSLWVAERSEMESIWACCSPRD